MNNCMEHQFQEKRKLQLWMTLAFATHSFKPMNKISIQYHQQCQTSCTQDKKKEMCNLGYIQVGRDHLYRLLDDYEVSSSIPSTPFPNQDLQFRKEKKKKDMFIDKERNPSLQAWYSLCMTHSNQGHQIVNRTEKKSGGMIFGSRIRSPQYL